MKKIIVYTFLLGAVFLTAGYLAGEAQILGSSDLGLTGSVQAEEPGEIKTLPAAPEAPVPPKADPEPMPTPAPAAFVPAPVPAPQGPVEVVNLPEWPVQFGEMGDVDTVENTAAMKVVPAPAPVPAVKAVGLADYIQAHAKPYEVRPGQSLSRIGKLHKVPYELIMKINGKTRPDLRAGERIQVLQGPFHVEVDCSERRLSLLKGDICLKTYSVAVGPGQLTPRGSFEVLSKLRNPPWTNPETRETIPFGNPENPLGTRWIAFTPGYGIHGTNEPDSIGTATSKGCIRMLNKDVEELYSFLRYAVSKVEIVE